MENNYKRNSILLGVAGAILIAAGGIYTGSKFKEAKKDTEMTKQELVEHDSKSSAAYEKIVQISGKKDLELTAKDSIIIDQNKEIMGLKHHLNGSRAEYNTEIAKYNDAILTIDSLKGIINIAKGESNVLQNMNIKYETELNNIGKLVDNYTRVNTEYQNQVAAEKDTINTMQKYLDIYVVRRRPIKEKDMHKVYLPGNLRLLPTDLAKIKEIKELNKEYKNK